MCEQTRVCTKCGVEKALSEFSKAKKGLFGGCSKCKVCEKARKAKYYAENSEKVKTREAKYRAENSEKEKARHAKYRAENPEKVKTRDAKYYAENSEKEKARHAKYRAENPEKVKARAAKYYAENSEGCLERVMSRARGLQKQGIAKHYRKECLTIRKQAKDYAELSGTEFHVDHICPVKAKIYDPDFDCYLPASGLHVPWNLDPLPAVHNLRKKNRVTLADVLRK